MEKEYTLKQMFKVMKKTHKQLDKVRIRQKNLKGDALMLALSVIYTSALSVIERTHIRKKISE